MTTQCDQILRRLQTSPGQWVGIPDLYAVSGSYVIHSRISNLRERGYDIDHKNVRAGRQCHSYYRLNVMAENQRLSQIELGKTDFIERLIEAGWTLEDAMQEWDTIQAEEEGEL